MFRRRKDRQKQEITERDAIALAQRDHRHFGMLYEAHFDVIFRFVFQRLGGNEAVAGDLTQQTFLKAMLNIHQYEDRGSSFRSWLFRIAQNEVNQFFRKETKHTIISVRMEHLSPLMEEVSIKLEEEENLERLVACINELEIEQQNLVELRFFQAMSFREIAEIYNTTEATAKMRVYRVLEKIKTKWNAANENV